MLVDEILDTAERIAAARDIEGGLMVRVDAQWSLLHAIDRAQGCPSIWDLARILGVSRQAAHELVQDAARGGRVRLLRNTKDRRIVQLALTPGARSMLETARARKALWVIALLNGLGQQELRATVRVLRVLRQRLTRDERC